MAFWSKFFSAVKFSELFAIQTLVCIWIWTGSGFGKAGSGFSKMPKIIRSGNSESGSATLPRFFFYNKYLVSSLEWFHVLINIGLILLVIFQIFLYSVMSFFLPLCRPHRVRSFTKAKSTTMCSISKSTNPDARSSCPLTSLTIPTWRPSNSFTSRCWN